MLDLCLLGTGGMMPLPYRWLTSLMLRCNGSSLLIDAGEGTQIAIKEKGWSFNPIDVICITHFHGDHIGGLPGLLLTIGNSDRKEPITIIGPKGIEKVVKQLRVIAPELPFELKFIELTHKGETIKIKDYTIEAFKVNHNITCYGYNIIIERQGKFIVEKAIENDIPKSLWSRLQKGEVLELEGRRYTPDLVLGEKRKGLKVTYCTDTRPTDAIEAFAKDADLFICEGMYGEQDKQNKAKEYKHMTFLEAANLAHKANVNELWLTHFSPSLVRPQEYLKDILPIFKNAVVGKDGMSKMLAFEED
ncbi:RNAse Z [Natranaerovirga hydrolytica]|uniref:Ribonuclease Z n=1 Tax=Natranaerovirga hydrolytica TaxID=680378 RepID=A0A4R1M7M7_9FIRM|nr:ribonuclease Z [Natranaerovirga hydrolytica]TCK87935.1 RNAse Z [Natranaerovirga hydrolytica]